jgi:hypothetical protein
MAKQRTETTTIVEGDSAELNPAPAPVVDTDDEERRDLVELGGGAASGNRWQVKRLLPADKRGFCAEYSAGEMSLARIQEEFGGGKYELRLLSPTGDYIRQKTVELQSRLGAVAPGQAPTSSPLSDPIVQLILAQAKEQSTTLLAVLQSALARPQPAIADPLDMLVKLKALLPEPAKGPSEMDLFLKGLEFGKDMGGGGGSETGIMDLIGEGIKHVGPMLAAKNSMGTSAALPLQPVRSLEAPAPRAIETSSDHARDPRTVTQPTDNETTPMLKVLNWLTKQTQALVFQASRGKNPNLYAEVFIDNLPDFVDKKDMLDRMTAENALQQLAQLNPNVAQFSDWFIVFRAATVQLLTEELEESRAANTDVRLNATDDPKL